MKPETLNELALFAGAGGGILGGKLRGWRTVCAVEWDAYARDVLVARQNDGCLEAFPIWDDVQTFDGRPWRGRVDVVSGGFPCQDISAAGKGAGIDGERSGMWKHMARVVGEILPRYVFVENSPMLVGRGLAVVIADLAEMGYDVRWGIVGAHHAGAPHKRDRIWLVAYRQSLRWSGGSRPRMGEGKEQGSRDGRGNVANSPDNGAGRGKQLTESSQGTGNVADTMCERSEAGLPEPEQRQEGITEKPLNDGCRCGEIPYTDRLNGDDCRHGASPIRRKQGREPSELSGGERDVGNAESQHGRSRAARQDGKEAGHASWWATEPNVGRVAYGVAARVDRLRCIGNGQVPAVVPLAWNLLRPTTDEIQ